MTRPNIERKTVWFDFAVWQMLNSLMRAHAAGSPSLMIEQMVKDAYNQIKYKKGTENGRTVATA